MKTAGRENPTHGVAWPRNRAHGAAGQNRSRSIKWAEKQEEFQPKEMCFFLTSPFIEQSGSYHVAARGELLNFPLRHQPCLPCWDSLSRYAFNRNTAKQNSRKVGCKCPGCWRI